MNLMPTNRTMLAKVYVEDKRFLGYSLDALVVLAKKERDTGAGHFAWTHAIRDIKAFEIDENGDSGAANVYYDLPIPIQFEIAAFLGNCANKEFEEFKVTDWVVE